MKFVPAELAGVIVVEPDVHRDSRGYFLETYNAQKYKAGGIDGPFVQDNHSRSLAARFAVCICSCGARRAS